MGNFLKKCQVFGNFLTVKWQFSGGSAPQTVAGLTVTHSTGEFWMGISNRPHIASWPVNTTHVICTLQGIHFRSFDILTQAQSGQVSVRDVVKTMFSYWWIVCRPMYLYLYKYKNVCMCVCSSVCSRFSRLFGIRLGYPLAQSYLLGSKRF